MSWNEVQVRAHQEFSKRWDAALYRLGVSFDGDDLRRHAEVEARFFFAPQEVPRLAELLRNRLPAETERIVREAERICQHRFDLLGYEDLNYGPEIDWHLDPVHGKRAPHKPWFWIRYLNFAEVGDAKIIWELNRHQHLVTLARAYCLTQNKRYANELFRQWYHWQQENPYPMGINWASSLEVAFRSLSWLWVRHLLADGSIAPRDLGSDLLRALAISGRHIERYLSTYFSPNTHLLGEGVALFFVGTLCPQLPSARRWQDRGWQIVLAEAQRQVQADGTHFEQSTYYHVYALDFFLHARILAARNDFSIPAEFDETILKMLKALCVLGQANTVPCLGDADGGRVFDPRRNRAEHLLDPLATGACLFGGEDFKAIAGGLREETLWLLGEEGVSQFDRIPSTPLTRKSARLEASGLSVMASQGPDGYQQLLLDAGPQGAGTAGHGHAEALSLHLSVDGRDFLIDPGTFAYASNQGEDRDLFRRTAAHNTLQVDGLSQAETAGPFAWRSLPVVRTEEWIAGETFDLFGGSHSGYCRLREPVIHRRWVFYLKPRFWLVRDIAEGKGLHQLDLFWHFAPGIHSCETHGGAVVAVAHHKSALAFLPLMGHGWSPRIRQESCSPVYGRREPSLGLQFTTRCALPSEFVTLLLPMNGLTEPLGNLLRIGGKERKSEVRGYHYRSAREDHYFFFAEGKQSWSLAGFASDAQFVYVGWARQGDRQHVVLCNGSYVDVEGRRVLACQKPVNRCEWLRTGVDIHIFCSDKGEALHSLDGLFLDGELIMSGSTPSCSKDCY